MNWGAEDMGVSATARKEHPVRIKLPRLAAAIATTAAAVTAVGLGAPGVAAAAAAVPAKPRVVIGHESS